MHIQTHTKWNGNGVGYPLGKKLRGSTISRKDDYIEMFLAGSKLNGLLGYNSMK